VDAAALGVQWESQGGLLSVSEAFARKTTALYPPSLKASAGWYQVRRAAFAETGADGQVVWS
jgi:hypothetical protein